ncbi:hypothetical protein WJX79_004386 [Trebouxia sp. C0005]
MKVVVQVEKCPDATWQADLTPDTKIDDIKLNFCQHNGLSPETCVLSSKGTLLKDQPKSGNKVQLRADFPPTLAFCVAYSIKPTDVSHYKLVSRLWQAAAESFCSNKYTAALMSDKTLQSQIAALPAEEILPIDLSQTQKELTSEVLTKLPEAARPVLLCMQILRAKQPGLPQETSSLNDVLAKLCEAKIAAEPDLPLSQSPLFRHVAVLKSALLVIKAAMAAASHMLKSGGLTLLTAALEQGKSVARHAFSVLHCLSSKPTLPAEQTAANEALLARMQGLRRCSALLCPIFSQDQASQAQRAAEAFDPKSITDVCQREGHINFMYGVTATMTRLLASQPLSCPPEAYDGDLLDAHSVWPTPTASQWTEIQIVALRLMVLLEWCTEELSGNKYTPEEVEDLIALKKVLVVLLHQLLLAHTLNPKLSMERIFRFGFVTIMNEWITQKPDHVLMNNLGVAFLRRISSDKAIFESMGSADPGRQADSVCTIWNLIYLQLGMPLDPSDPFQQLRYTEAIDPCSAFHPGHLHAAG